MEPEVKETPTNKGPELEGADIRDNIDEQNAGFEYDSLFDDEKELDEKALTGEDDTAEKAADAGPEVEEPEKKADEKPEASLEKKEEPEKKGEEKAKPDEAKPDEKKDAKEEPEEPSDDKKPPSGYVPQEALHQERQLTKNLKAENARLAAELEKASNQKPNENNEFEEFKVLNETELDELIDKDPDEAIRYQNKLVRYMDYRHEVRNAEDAEKKAEAKEQAILEEAFSDIEGVIPGITDGKSQELVDALVDHAEENGIHPNVLKYITDPRTKLHTEDGQHFLMGKGAAQLMRFVKTSHENISKVPNEDKLRIEIEAELRPKIEAEVQKTLMEKFQSGTGTFQSLDQIAGSGKKDDTPQSGPLTEAEWAKLSEAEQAAYLGG